MTAAGPVAGAPRIPGAASYGVITGDIAGLGEVRHLVGGDGEALWKQVINGMHLPGGWGCVEYVELPPGASCGRHLHDKREEIYYILGGDAEMTVNGETVPVTVGDLVTCPLGTVHGISCPPGAAGNMSFFVVEMAPGTRPPGAAPHRASMPAGLAGCAGYRGGGHDQGTRVAILNLPDYLTGPWRRFTLIEIPAGDAIGPARLPADIAEVLFVTAGEAEITAAGTAVKGGRGLTVGTPLGAEVTIANTSRECPLTVISTQAAG